MGLDTVGHAFHPSVVYIVTSRLVTGLQRETLSQIKLQGWECSSVEGSFSYRIPKDPPLLTHPTNQNYQIKIQQDKNGSSDSALSAVPGDTVQNHKPVLVFLAC